MSVEAVEAVLRGNDGATWPIPTGRNLGQNSIRMVLICLAEHADEYGANACPSARTIARECGLNQVRDVRRALDVLLELGYIVKTAPGKPRHHGDVYQITLSSIPERASATGTTRSRPNQREHDDDHLPQEKIGDSSGFSTGDSSGISTGDSAEVWSGYPRHKPNPEPKPEPLPSGTDCEVAERDETAEGMTTIRLALLATELTKRNLTLYPPTGTPREALFRKVRNEMIEILREGREKYPNARIRILSDWALAERTKRAGLCQHGPSPALLQQLAATNELAASTREVEAQ